MGDSGTVVYNDGRDVVAAAELAKQSDYAIVFVGTLSRWVLRCSSPWNPGIMSLHCGVK